MPQSSVRVFSFSQAALRRCVSAELQDDASAHARRRADLLAGYLSNLRAKTVVEELEYVDRDYLEDFVGFYVSCFEHIKKKCRRLHFFRKEFDPAAFYQAIGGDGDLTETSLRRAYLGFIVVRPLPQAPIGRTCLATYSGRRRKPGCGRRDVLIGCEANLCGMRLSVRSVPYQEQDHVTAACATSAIWSALQVSGRRFHHPIPPPVTITQWAVENDFARDTRGIPNSGLTIKEMLHAVRKVGLEPNCVHNLNPERLKDVVHAFAGLGLPVLLGWRFVDKSNAADNGSHAVSVFGYGHGDDPHPGVPSSWSSKIDRLFVHDDQVVPFAKVEFAPRPPELEKEIASNQVLKIRGWDDEIVVPLAAIVPLHRKVRVSYMTVADVRELISTAMQSMVAECGDAYGDLGKFLSQLVDGSEWDVQIVTCADYKRSVRGAAVHPPSSVAKTLASNMPRFVWRLSLGHSTVGRLFDILLDATSYEPGSPAFSVVCRHEAAAALFRSTAPFLARCASRLPNEKANVISVARSVASLSSCPALTR